MGDKPLDVLAASEIGECIRAILDDPEEYKSKQVSCEAIIKMSWVYFHWLKCSIENRLNLETEIWISTYKMNCAMN